MRPQEQHLIAPEANFGVFPYYNMLAVQAQDQQKIYLAISLAILSWSKTVPQSPVSILLFLNHACIPDDV